MEILQGRQALEDLQASGTYLFHGSPDQELEVLAPQIVSSRAETSNGPVEFSENDKYIFATDSIDVAIFAAVVFHLGRSGWYTHKDRGHVSYTFNADDEVKEEARNSKGFVYVFLKQHFHPSNTGDREFVSEQSLVPLYKVEVGSTDLRPSLDVIQPDKNAEH